MRIAFHFPRLASGGVEKMRIILAKELLNRSIDVDFVLCRVEGEYLDQVPCDVRVINLGAARTRDSLIPMIRYLKTESPDYLISSLGPQNVIATVSRILSGARTRVFVTQHNALSLQSTTRASFQQRMMPALYRWILPLADGVIAVSKGIANDMAKSTGFAIDHINVIYNPACTAIGPDYSTPIEPSLSDGKYIISIGRLVHQKGFDDLLRAFALVTKRHPELKLVILGTGPLENELKQLSNELGIGSNTYFLGFRPDPRPYLSRADVFVLSSRFEGFGNVLVEALAVGTSVVSTDCDYGPSEILNNGEFGRLVKVGDAAALAEAIEANLQCLHDRERLQARAQIFSPKSIVDQYLALLQKS